MMLHIERRPILQEAQHGWTPYQEFGKHTAAIQCPVCDRIFSLLNHVISADGSVSPSVVCPWSDCTFHVFVRLNDWSSPA